MGKKFDVSPYVVNQSTQDGKLKSKDQGLGLDIYSKFGNLGVSKNTNTQSYDGGSELKTKSKNINYGKNFKLGNRCVTIRLSYEELAAIFWVTPAPGYMELEGFQTILFTGGFTFPNLRGKGVFPIALKHAMLLLLSEQPNHRIRFVGNVIFTNKSSLKATHKSGFKRIGISFGISRWGCVYFKDNGKAYFRFFNK